MIGFAFISLVLLFIVALGNSWWWRTASPNPPNALFAWGVFFFALYVMWPTIKNAF